MKEQKRLDLNNFNHQLVITGLTGMVEDNGLTPHEALEVLEDIKRNIFFALMEISKEKKVK